MEKITNLIPFIIIGAITFMALGQFVGAQEDLSSARASYVQTVCDKARGEISGASEQACADAQDEAGATYLCSVSGSCWVEVK